MVVVWTGFMWFRIRLVDGILRTRSWIFDFYKIREIVDELSDY
jgi:hypothetical protein